MKRPMVSEKAVQNAIFHWLVMHQHLALRINSGAMMFEGEQAGGTVKRFVRFATWQVVGQALTWAGVSDILACCNGRFAAIEIKAPGKKENLSEAQGIFLAAVKRCGGLALVADCIEDVERALGV